jgi:hypothetical protein
MCYISHLTSLVYYCYCYWTHSVYTQLFFIYICIKIDGLQCVVVTWRKHCMTSVYSSVDTWAGIRRVSKMSGPQNTVDTWKIMFFSNIVFYVRCSWSISFLIQFFHEHQPHRMQKNCAQNSCAAIAQLILFETVENDICNLYISL